MSFWPEKIEIRDLGIISLWAFVSAIIWSIILLILIFSISSFMNVWSAFSVARTWAWEQSAIFPLTLSVITFLSTSLTVFVNYFFLNFAAPERYKKNIVIFGQIAFFTFLTYLFVLPVYIYVGLIDYDYIMITFLFHTTIVIFGTSLILEILNNYRYVLVSVYWCFVWIFFSMIITGLIFSSFESGNAKLISLLFLMPIINLSQVFFKGLFDFWYFHYNRLTNQDQIGDIFYQIENEEKEKLAEEEEKNSI